MAEASLSINIKEYENPVSVEQVTIHLPRGGTFYYYVFKYKNSMLLKEIES